MVKYRTPNERQMGTTQSKVEELEELNQPLRNCDKMKDDAIAQLSDQLLATSAAYHIHILPLIEVVILLSVHRNRKKKRKKT
jgi:hypothetical protein